jgi:hypothetical protein
MRASCRKTVQSGSRPPRRPRVARTRIALTSPLFAFGAAALGSVAVWIGVFKLILG